MSEPKNSRQLALLEQEVLKDYKYYTKKAQREVLQAKQENKDNLVKALGQVGKNWVNLANRLDRAISDQGNDFSPKQIASIITSLEKIQTNLGVSLGIPTSETALLKQQELEHKTKVEVFKTAEIFKKYLKKAGLALDVDADALQDVIVEAGQEILSIENQSQSKSETEGSPISSASNENSSSAALKTSDI